MSSCSQGMVRQGLLEEEAFFSFPPQNLTFPPLTPSHQSLNTSFTLPILSNPQTLLSSSPKHTQRLLSLQRSTANLTWAWGEGNIECSKSNNHHGDDDDDDDDDHHHLGVSAMKMKKIKARRKVREPRFCFKTMSDVDVLDDGYKWRKYGQKVVKNTQHPRSYYRCTQDNCRVKKRVERLAEDPRMVITTYEGRHVHSPSHDLEDSQAPSHLNFFW
ncbi:probable WRKY transcription factor 13 [Carica papaya]|uniref:probable WRKY transcription factor 13 n=1 Tax=Carica papaya TaxID=3649 RepID=UPI000B8CF370|nr:probable WRKY transcription factor 13 [Carica papaya]